LLFIVTDLNGIDNAENFMPVTG